MSNKAVANRYAQALYDIVDAEVQEQVAEELTAISQALQEPDVSALFANPRIPRSFGKAYTDMCLPHDTAGVGTGACSSATQPAPRASLEEKPGRSPQRRSLSKQELQLHGATHNRGC